MIDYEVVARREAYGSYLKAYPYLPKGHLFSKLVVQLFLKTSGKNWEGVILPEDDPLMIIVDGNGYLCNPKLPMDREIPYFAILEEFPLCDNLEVIEEIKTFAAKTFLALEKAWQLVPGNRRLIDFKVEFGTTKDGELVLADVIDSDSWRVLDSEGGHLDKQIYRDGGETDEVLAKYKIAAGLTGLFQVPNQQVILWAGSEDDDLDSIEKLLSKYVPYGYKVTRNVCSMHKQPVKGIFELNQLVHKIPDSVIIALIGMSNGAAPIIGANESVPVITVPANYDKTPNDVFSSLHTPSLTPVSTIISPKNAALQALKSLSMRNPRIYMELRYAQEKLLTNVLILE